ncbi:uncharacterized protein F5Z01DRAFT_634164 [Emericellopsis atlantica]|uniref:BTB domain-containing protein n=1 Tax=Emericellopsis atlantica TaxID=2614577 RepID=A0A9P7ZRM9_9HYPO|nr:uncharacterized protein F5Z01DRAFT_634164 [Emericellopsis atlantica]KAG9256582.1 hypothetical protein F5Z01DRAFT_634164 [Emericellopsis atlantica]
MSDHKEESGAGTSPPPRTIEQWTSMLQNLRRGKYADCTIQSVDRTYRVHKALFCSQSSVFEAALDGPFKEAQTGVLNLPEDHPQALEALIDYIYLGDYDASSLIPTEPDRNQSQEQEQQTVDHAFDHAGFVLPFAPTMADLEQVPLHAEVFILADKYDLRSLCGFASEKILALIAKNRDHIVDENFLQIIPLLYTHEAFKDEEELRKEVVKALSWAPLANDPERVRDVLAEVPELALDLVLSLQKSPFPQNVVQEALERHRSQVRNHIRCNCGHRIALGYSKLAGKEISFACRRCGQNLRDFSHTLR